MVCLSTLVDFIYTKKRGYAEQIDSTRNVYSFTARGG